MGDPHTRDSMYVRRMPVVKTKLEIRAEGRG